MWNQNVYDRMSSRGVDWNDPRVQRRFQNRSFQADQGTLAKGQWQNRGAMRAQHGPRPDSPSRPPSTGAPKPGANLRTMGRRKGRGRGGDMPNTPLPAPTGMAGLPQQNMLGGKGGKGERGR